MGDEGKELAFAAQGFGRPCRCPQCNRSFDSVADEDCPHCGYAFELEREGAAGQTGLPDNEDDSMAAVLNIVAEVANRSIALKGTGGISFDQLAEEVLELHLALRGKHPDPPEMEWLEVASLAVNALRILLIEDVQFAYRLWLNRHWYNHHKQTKEAQDE